MTPNDDDAAHEPRPVPTIAEVAAAAGVSKGTVSHVLSGRVPVAEATRDRVLAAIRHLGYRPAEAARSLTARKRLTSVDTRFGPSVPRLTAIGYVSVDYMACLDRLPEREERRVASEILKMIGGPAANVASIAAGIGSAWPVAASILTTIGDDQDSDWAVAELARRGVETVLSRSRHGGRLNRALVLVEADGRRTIVNEPLSLAALDVRRFIEVRQPEGVWCLHFEGYQIPSQIEVLPLARARGFMTSMHATGLPPGWLSEHGRVIFEAFDIVVLQRETLAALPGCPTDPAAAAAHLAEARDRRAPGARWPRGIILTLGAEGAIALADRGPPVRVRAQPATVRDRTGAGDALTGTVLAMTLHDVELAEAVGYGCLAGSLAVTRFGAAELRPTAADLMARAPAKELPT
jgi:ribokinase